MAEAGLKEFLDRMEELAPIFAKSMQFGLLPENCDITMPQCLVMRVAYLNDSCKMSDISNALGVTMANVTSMVDRLIRDGYVERHEDPADRRIVRISLTKEGRKTYEAVREGKRRHFMMIFSKISVKERNQLLEIMQKVAQELKNEQEGVK
ncbi:MAG: MarR family transcriptional regulator [Candidatus Margulisiibacteriota bacterium]|jgi:DNA-binding MarR family transcriptional regulator